jgi:sulfite exporter TauE/SafE
MTLDLLIAALVFGLLTGFHCAGMCGPIAISLPLSDESWAHRTVGSLIYNFGRIITYSLMGAVFGLLGQGFKMAGFQQWLSVAIGALMILSVLFPLLFKSFASKSPVFPVVERIKDKLGNLFGTKTKFALFTIGLLNGLLPCGPVYVAIGLSLASANIFTGALYMAVFGVGTVPVMLSLSLVGNYFTTAVRRKIRQFVPVFIIVLGVWFVLKGLGLGVYLISPGDQKLKINKEIPKKCCNLNTFKISL